MLRVNLFGGPGVGKSVLAARVYAELNCTGNIAVEMVREFHKPLAYEGVALDTWDQVYTFANQLWAEHRLFKAGLEVLVTDSPVLLQCIYARQLHPDVAPSLRNIALQYEQAHPSLNFLVQRQVPYNHTGRYQEKSELPALDHQIETAMTVWGLKYLSVGPGQWLSVIRAIREILHNND